MNRHPFVGRTGLLATLRERLEKSRCGDGGAIVLCGEAGIGKSRVLEHFRDRIAGDDPGLVATAVLDYAPSPFAPFSQAIAAWTERRPGLFTMHPGLRDAVSSIVRADDTGEAPSAGERRRCFDSIARLFRLASAEMPTTLVIDDLHDADPATLQLLRHVIVATERSALFVLAAARVGPNASDAFRTEFAKLVRSDRVRTIDLAPLTGDETATLVRERAENRLSRSDREAIARRADGNPLFVDELVRHALAGAGGSAGTDVPAAIAASVLEHVAGLDPEGRAVLEIAAVLGREFRCSQTVATLGGDPSGVPRALRAAVRLGLLEETDDADVFRFRHALVRETLYGDLLELDRRAIHARIARALDREPLSDEALAALAWHAHAAADRALSARSNEHAGDRAVAAQAFELAARHYERALEAVRSAAASHAAPDDAARLGRKLATAHLVAGFPDRAREPATEVFEALRAAGDRAGAVDALLLLADVARFAGDDEVRLAHLDLAASLAADSSDAGLASKHAFCRSELALAERDPDGVLSVPAAPPPGDLATALALANARAHALLMQRRYREALVEQSLALRSAMKRGSLEQIAATHLDHGMVCMLGGELERAGIAFGRSARVSEARWATTDRAIGLAFQAETELMRGNVPVARALIVEALDDGRRSDHHALITMAGRTGLFLAMRQRDPQFAAAVVDALDLDRLFYDRTPERCFPLSGAYSQYLLQNGKRDEAHAVLARAVDRLSVKRLQSTDWSVCTLLSVAAIGDERHFAQARRPLERWYAPFAPAFVGLFDATVAERGGDGAAAARHAEASLEPFERFGFRFETALALDYVGRKREALAIAERFGFDDVAARIADELVPRNRQGRAAGTLTARERAIAELVRDGLRNREIAERLVVSEKTVESHLSSIFAKLRVRARTEIASRLAASDTADETRAIRA